MWRGGVGGEDISLTTRVTSPAASGEVDGLVSKPSLAVPRARELFPAASGLMVVVVWGRVVIALVPLVDRRQKVVSSEK